MTGRSGSPGTTSTTAPRPRVVVVGGGAGGLELATRLGRRRGRTLEIVLVDRSPTHLWKPRLHEVAVGLIGPGEDTVSYLAQGRAAGFAFALGELLEVDTRRRVVRLARVVGAERDEEILGEREIGWDRLVLAFGSRVDDFGLPGVRDHCHMLDTAAQALRFQRAFFELAVQVAAGGRERLRVAIVGAGATGIELAAELHHVVHALGRYGGLDARHRLEIILIDRAPRLLASSDPATSRLVARTLEQLGIATRLGASVAEATASAVRLKDGESIACEISVWASGITGLEVAKRLRGFDLRPDGRIGVGPSLACHGVDGVFAIGDCAAAPGGERPLPPTAQVASQQAVYLAAAFAKIPFDDGRAVAPFVYRPRGTLVSLGEKGAAFELPGRTRAGGAPVAQGRWAKALYVSLFHLHRVALHGWWRAGALALSDRLRGLTQPPVKLH